MSHVSGGAAYTIQRVPASSQLSALNIKQSFYGREKQLLKGTGLETGLVSYCPSTILLPHDYPVLPRRRVHRPRRSQRLPSLPLPQYNHTFAEVSRHPQTRRRVGDHRIQFVFHNFTQFVCRLSPQGYRHNSPTSCPLVKTPLCVTAA